jgi:hypothetical protein
MTLISTSSNQGAHTMSTPSTYDADDGQLAGGEISLGMAQRAFDDGYATLYLASGQQKYGEEEHTRRLGELRASLTSVIGNTHTVADEVEKKSQTVIDHLAYGDPFDALDPIDKSAAASAKTFVQEDAARIAPAELLTRLRHVLDSGDKASMYLWARYVGQRIQAAASPDAATSEHANLPAAGRQELAQLVDDLQAKVRGPEALTKRERAAAKIARARELRRTARTAYDDAHGTQRRQFDAMKREYATRF